MHLLRGVNVPRGRTCQLPSATPAKLGRMCLICVEIAKSKMTVKEARTALREMRTNMDRAHLAEVEAKLDEAEKSATKP